ncbi:MAG: hypothetical protein IPJ85_18055 [Flavobacteriales bacterium]|nr:hypothetical protein [Flavobacteriales bacterium]
MGRLSPPELGIDALARWRSTTIDAVLGDADEYADPEQLDETAVRFERAGISMRKHLFQGGHKLDAITLARLLRGE